MEENGRPGDRSELVGEMRDWIAFLERELERRAGGAAGLRRIVAALTQRIPEIDPPRQSPSEQQESPETGAGLPMGSVLSAATEAAQEPPERVSWWRRMFGG